MLPVDFDAHADRLFDLLEVFVFVCRAKRDTLTASACSCRPSDAVNISVGFERHIEVDDMAACLALTKTKTRLLSGSVNSRSSNLRLLPRSTNITHCLTRSAVLAGGVTITVTW